jgi:hypothetical protein
MRDGRLQLLRPDTERLCEEPGGGEVAPTDAPSAHLGVFVE